MLTPEEQAKLDELTAKLDAKPNKDPDIKNMSDAQVREAFSGLLDAKRDANAEAKDLREKFNTLNTKLEADDKKKADSEKTTADKLLEATAQIETLQKGLVSTKLKSRASADLISKGFKPELVEVGLTDLTDDNYKEKVKDFEKRFEDLKTESPGNDINRRPTDRKPPGDPNKPDKITAGAQAMKDMYTGGAESAAKRD